MPRALDSVHRCVSRAIRVVASRPDVRVSATPTLARHDNANVGVISIGSDRACVVYSWRTVTATIETVEEPTADVVEALARLLPQLSSAAPPDAAELATILAGDTTMFIARVDGVIVGSLTLVLYRIATGLKAWIEDVVVDEAARGHGVGEALSNAALDAARSRGAKAVSLTSRPSRAAANRLYQGIGFSPRDTNVYRYDL